MQLTYDQVTDTMYVYFSQEPVARTEELAERVIVDYDAEGEVRGIEILEVRLGSAGIDVSQIPRHADLARALESVRQFPVNA